MRWIFFVLVATSPLFAGTKTEQLKAGQKYVFESEYNRYEIFCTATPIDAKVLTKSCTCAVYDERPFTQQYKFRLSQSLLLSDGKEITRVLTDRLNSQGDCEREKLNSYAKECAVVEVKP